MLAAAVIRSQIRWLHTATRDDEWGIIGPASKHDHRTAGRHSAVTGALVKRADEPNGQYTLPCTSLQLA